MNGISTTTVRRRTRVIGWQLQDLLCTLQFVLPIIDLTRKEVTGYRGALPARIIGVLKIQHGELRLSAGDKTGVQFSHLVKQQVHRPPIGNDVVDDQSKNMIPGSYPKQLCAQKRTCTEIERPARFLTSNLKRSLLALHGRKPSEVQDRQIKLQFG